MRCLKCNGTYLIRHGKYGFFGGCSNYPKCKSTYPAYKMALGFFVENGVNIYSWQKQCWKCGKDIPVYTYFLNCDLQKLSSLFNDIQNVGIGDFKYLDKVLEKKYSSVKIQYSRTVKTKYMANNCVYCKSIQGRNYVVEDPHEIMNDLYDEKPYVAMQKHTVGKIEVSENSAFEDELKAYFNEINYEERNMGEAGESIENLILKEFLHMATEK